MTSNRAFDEPYLTKTDTSAFAIGAVFSQGPFGKILYITYDSRNLCNARTKWSTIESEILATVLSVKYLEPYFSLWSKVPTHN